MCKGELDRSESKKFTGSADQSGTNRAPKNILQRIIKLTLSLKVNIYINFVFRALESLIPAGTELPVACKSSRWTPTITITNNGTK